MATTVSSVLGAAGASVGAGCGTAVAGWLGVGAAGNRGVAGGWTATSAAPVFVVGTLLAFVFPAIACRNARRRSSSRFVIVAVLVAGVEAGASGGACACKAKLVISKRKSVVFTIVYWLRLLVYRSALAVGHLASLTGWWRLLALQSGRHVFQFVSRFFPLVSSLQRLRLWA